MSRKILRTRLCELLDIEYPILLAGMGGAANAELAAAVSEAGGLGIIGAINLTPDELDAEIRKLKKLTSKPFGVDTIAPTNMVDTATIEELRNYIPDEAVSYASKLAKELGIPVPEGTQFGKEGGTGWAAGMTPKQIEVVYEHKVPVFAAALGSPAFMVPEAHSRGMKVVGLVGTVNQARKEADAGVDIVVAQGHEGGGHTGHVGTLPLVRLVAEAVVPTPVVAAGGIADGRGLVAALALGACGVWCGTAFLCTHESGFEQVAKERIVQATERDTRVTRVFTGKTCRLLNTKLIEKWEREGPVMPFPLPIVVCTSLQDYIGQAKMVDNYFIPCGQICGALKEIKSAKQVMQEIVDQAVQILDEELPAKVKTSE
jgi:NAD(P)H-dependent flavin oxidoreductase YrpB (nitropropane dioxygenase family)